MKTINLLPEWYINENKRRNAQQTHLLILVVIGTLMAGACVVARTRIAAIATERDALAKQVDAQRDISAQLDRTNAELRRLQRLQSAFHDVGNTLPMTRVIQQIFNNMTPGMALSNVSLEVRQDPLKSSPGAKARYHDVAHISVTGVAPDSVRVAQMIGKLSANPLFSEITLNYLRTELLKDYSIKRFEILLNLDMGRLSNQDPDQNNVPNQQAATAGGDHAS